MEETSTPVVTTRSVGVRYGLIQAIEMTAWINP